MTDTTTLPPLPEPRFRSVRRGGLLCDDGYDEDQMQAFARAALAQSAQAPEDRPCTCHPEDEPPVPCARKYALSDCREAAQSAQAPAQPTSADYLTFLPAPTSGAQAPAPEPVATVTLGGINSSGEYDDCDVEWHGEFADMDAMQERYVTGAPVRIPLYAQAPAQPAPSVEAVMELAEDYADACEHRDEGGADIRYEVLRAAVEALARGAR